MAILAIFHGVGFTQEMYESLRGEVRWESEHAPGGVFHASGFDEAGDLHVADVWDSMETMNEFVATRLMPGLEKLGIPAPSVSVFPAYNINMYPAATAYALS